MDEKKRLLVLHGHESTVCSVVADEHKIVSGAADKVGLGLFVNDRTIQHGSPSILEMSHNHIYVFYRHEYEVILTNCFTRVPHLHQRKRKPAKGLPSHRTANKKKKMYDLGRVFYVGGDVFHTKIQYKAPWIPEVSGRSQLGVLIAHFAWWRLCIVLIVLAVSDACYDRGIKVYLFLAKTCCE